MQSATDQLVFTPELSWRGPQGALLRQQQNKVVAELLSLAPPVLRDMSLAMARGRDCPPEILLFSGLVAVGGAVGKSFELVVSGRGAEKPARSNFANLMVFISAPSCTGKSNAETMMELLWDQEMEWHRDDSWPNPERRFKSPPGLLLPDCRAKWLRVALSENDSVFFSYDASANDVTWLERRGQDSTARWWSQLWSGVNSDTGNWWFEHDKYPLYRPIGSCCWLTYPQRVSKFLSHASVRASGVLDHLLVIHCEHAWVDRVDFVKDGFDYISPSQAWDNRIGNILSWRRAYVGNARKVSRSAFIPVPGSPNRSLPLGLWAPQPVVVTGPVAEVFWQFRQQCSQRVRSLSQDIPRAKLWNQAGELAEHLALIFWLLTEPLPEPSQEMISGCWQLSEVLARQAVEFAERLLQIVVVNPRKVD